MSSVALVRRATRPVIGMWVKVRGPTGGDMTQEARTGVLWVRLLYFDGPMARVTPARTTTVARIGNKEYIESLMANAA